MNTRAHIVKTRADFYNTPYLADSATGKRVIFRAENVPGKGWTVARVVGSKKEGRMIERAAGFENIDNYSLAQAQIAAENMQRDEFRFAQEVV